jgi:catechol 2,3-dioxygenase-like lactoylglutathione lyase family enzyme
MSDALLNIDHVGFGVRNLPAAAQRFRQLGFTLTTYSEHTKRGLDGKPVPAGSGQYSAMFESGYIELLGISDPSAKHFLADRIGRYTGLHHLLFGVDDPDAASRALRHRGVLAGEPTDWERPVAQPDGTNALARFRFFALPMESTPEGLVAAVRQLTPDVVRPTGTLKHANTAVALAGVVILSANPPELAKRYTVYLNLAPVPVGGGFVFTLPSRQELCIVGEDELRELFPGVITPAPNCLMACVLRVKDLGVARERIGASGATLRPWAQGFWVDGGLALGGVLAFAA